MADPDASPDTDPPAAPTPSAPSSPSSTTSSPSAGRAGRPVWAVLAVLFAVLAIVLAAVWQATAGDVDGLTRERDDRLAVQRVAAAFGEAYLSYDFEADAAGDAVVELASEAFAEDFAETRAPGIEQLFADLQTTTVAMTTEVFVSDVGERSARALVVVDVAATSTANGDQDLTNLSFVLDLVREDGDWKVDRVAPAPQPDIGDPAGGPSTTAPADVPPSTTAPASTP